MKRLLPISTILLLLAVPIWGQDEDYPKVEVFGGGSWLEVDAGSGERNDFYGWQASISGNFHENIGLVFDVGGQYKSVPGITTQFYEFLVGPRFMNRINEGTVFGHALAGLKYARFSGPAFPLLGLGDTLSDTVFAIGFGGGADLNVGDWGAFRMLQIDIIADRFSGEWIWNERASIGFVFKFGY